jgi:hypothetical protein
LKIFKRFSQIGDNLVTETSFDHHIIDVGLDVAPEHLGVLAIRPEGSNE